MKRSRSEYITLVIKGMGMGAADVIPGVSGGTIAFITGIYEELVDSIKSVNLKALKLLFTGKFSEFLRSVNGVFLFCIVLGIAISIFSLARGLKFLLDNYPVAVWSFFFGLVLASAIYVARKIKRWNASIITGMIAGIIAAYYITTISPASPNTSWWFIFLSGSVAICAMILPGISGSFILVLLGMYKYIIEAVGNLDLRVLLIFIAGAAIGIVAFSNLLSWLLKKYHNLTIAVLAGFMAGSLNKIWPWKRITQTFTDRHGEIKPLTEKNILPGNYEQFTGQDSWITWAVILAVTGFITIFVIEGLTKRKKDG
ncbi:MAG: DUF368 domain-containing protein [Prolixibacteraceae bacterium]|nr:DUF368 domain-containing protein [Prolixibacteraceae bacterium]